MVAEVAQVSKILYHQIAEAEVVAEVVMLELLLTAFCWVAAEVGEVVALLVHVQVLLAGAE